MRAWRHAAVGIVIMTVLTVLTNCRDNAAQQPEGATGTPLEAPTRLASADLRGKIVFANGDDHEIYVMNADGTNPVKLTNDPGYHGAPDWSPDGTRIAFHSTRSGNYDIYVMNADGSDVRRLTSNSVNDVCPAWSPDGSKVAFTRDKVEKEALYVMNTDGTEAVRISDWFKGVDHHIDWSPDGTRIAFVKWIEQDFLGDLWGAIHVTDADGIQPSSRLVNGFSPSWSPDGSKIVFYRYSWEKRRVFLGYSILRRGTILVVDTNTGRERAVTDDSLVRRDPAWSLDGSNIVFVGAEYDDRKDVPTGGHICVMDVDTGEEIRLTSEPGNYKAPKWWAPREKAAPTGQGEARGM